MDAAQRVCLAVSASLDPFRGQEVLERTIAAARSAAFQALSRELRALGLGTLATVASLRRAGFEVDEAFADADLIRLSVEVGQDPRDPSRVSVEIVPELVEAAP